MQHGGCGSEKLTGKRKQRGGEELYMGEHSVKNRKRSLKVRLIQAFFITSILPIVLINIFSYFNTSSIVRDNVRELTRDNLQQTRSSLDVWLESYEDILFQVYTDDDIVDLIDKINREEDVSVSKNQLRRTLHGLFYTKEYIKCISVLTENGTLFFYDLLTGSSTRNSWLTSFDMTQEELYDCISGDNDTHVIPTQKAITFGADDHYLFHIGHRIIDYRDVKKQLGIVVVSIDEELLGSVCSVQSSPEDSFNFIVSRNGTMVSHPQKELLAAPVLTWTEDEEARREAYEEFVRTQEPSGGEHRTVDFVYDDKFQCDIVHVSSQEEVVRRLNAQQQITLIVLGISLGTLVVVIMILTRRLSGSLQNMVPVMNRAGRGDLSARVELEKNMPGEVEIIAQEFNHMLERLSASMENERAAGEKQRQAEIAALEAQLNPHFLYNTLDTINWMAIDREEFEISNSISALAHILRYGIDNSNGIVPVREEVAWLKKYLFLQQTRLKNTFQCEIHVEPEVMGKKIHKLLLQPFVENAILHGFEGVNRVHILTISIERREEQLFIEIYDNGKGMDPETVRRMNQGIFPQSSDKNHIGMENAINRIHMYYGNEGEVRIASSEQEWTKIHVWIPLQEAGEDMEE